jgi:glycosyltransferase involved in cell wall biosynthesis
MVVSVVIPCFNVERDISECINAVLKQSYEHLEIILVDNNSRDNTISILKKFEKNYPETIQVLEEKKQGAPAARNRGLSVAKGDWIQFLDADDVLFPNKIEEQIALVKTHRDTDLVIANYLYQLSDTNRLPVKYAEENLWLSFVYNQLGITSCYLWKKEVLDHVGGWDESMNSSQEYELLFEFLKIDANIVFDKKYNTLVRRRKDSISTQSNQAMVWKTLIDQRIRVKKYLKESRTDFFNQHEIEIERAIIEHLSKLGVYDLSAACYTYKTELQIKPKLKDNNRGKFYRYAYNIFGFRAGTMLYKQYLIFLRFIGRYHY